MLDKGRRCDRCWFGSRPEAEGEANAERRRSKNDGSEEVMLLYGSGSKPNGYLFSRVPYHLFKRLSMGSPRVRGFDPKPYVVWDYFLLPGSSLFYSFFYQVVYVFGSNWNIRTSGWPSISPKVGILQMLQTTKSLHQSHDGSTKLLGMNQKSIQ